jgi:hypothetical protein
MVAVKRRYFAAAMLLKSGLHSVLLRHNEKQAPAVVQHGCLRQPRESGSVLSSFSDAEEAPFILTRCIFSLKRKGLPTTTLGSDQRRSLTADTGADFGNHFDFGTNTLSPG